ncbi:uncharacterized protein K441DRAFT_623584 [Cenococcum geophilum 1.58]|uniref:Uncharacterized protein n=1 Tax=Cenococcum geophilum 1.58 TaxID=794803 RepID=A0ACC8ELM4_9PEZI|nr:hypothetical protein K441DRAFT_623584 [Cenococcum geophilum 1.58]
MLSKLSLALLISAACCTQQDIIARDGCGTNYVSCSPSGAKSMTSPNVGPDMSSLYVDLLNSVAGIHFSKRELGTIDGSIIEKRESPSMCCTQGTSCLNLQGFNVPMCYDKFTTNYILADGSYGTITTGEYSGADGSKVNLLTGNFTISNGQNGNIYSNDESAKPNTATLSIPPQWTGTGVGSAIPITELASVGTTSTVIPVSTIAASTIETVISGKTTPISTILAMTVPASTITQPTTLAPVTTGITSQGAATASSTKKGAAVGFLESRSPVRISLLSAILYGVYAL